MPLTNKFPYSTHEILPEMPEDPRRRIQLDTTASSIWLQRRPLFFWLNSALSILPFLAGHLRQDERSWFSCLDHQKSYQVLENYSFTDNEFHRCKRRK
jgi:hypothetical protein